MKARVPGMQKGGGNVNAMLKKAQQAQEDMNILQEDLENREYEGSSPDNLVKVVVDGKHLIKSIKISKDAIDPDDMEMLEDFVTIAVNNAVELATKTADEEMSKLTGGLEIPGMPGLF